MKTYQLGKEKGKEARDKLIRGYKRLQVFTHATALAVLVFYAGTNAYAEVQAGDNDIATIVLTASTVLVGLTALMLYIRFFTDEN